MEYYYRMLATDRRGNLDDNGMIGYIVNGLGEDNNRGTLIAMHFNSCPV